MSLSTVFLIAALVCFLLAAFRVPFMLPMRVDWLALGFACVTASWIV